VLNTIDPPESGVTVGVPAVAAGRVDPSAQLAADDQVDADHTYQLRTASQLAIIVLIVLNFADILLTQSFLAHGVNEGNALMRGVVGDWRMTAVKAAVLVPLAWRTWNRRPTIGFTCLLWTAVGWYVLSAYVNWEILRLV
jgi:hypothetical protein